MRMGLQIHIYRTTTTDEILGQIFNFQAVCSREKVSFQFYHANSRAESENNATHPQNRNITFATRKQNNDDLKINLINTIKGLSKLSLMV